MQPWPDYARSEWARIGARWAEDEALLEQAVPEPDPLHRPETDEEPWTLDTGRASRDRSRSMLPVLLLAGVVLGALYALVRHG